MLIRRAESRCRVELRRIHISNPGGCFFGVDVADLEVPMC